MGAGNSEWKSATLNDIAGFKDILDAVQVGADTSKEAIDILIEIANVTISVVEIVSSLVSGVEDVKTLAVKTAIDSLETIIKALIKVINDTLDFGLYVLPHYESFPFFDAVRNDILNPGVESTSLKPVDAVRKVASMDNPSEYYYRRARVGGRNSQTDYATFIQDISESFADTKDRLRPQFDAATPLSGVTIAVAATDVKLFIIFYLMIRMLLDKDNALNHADEFARILRITIGQAETLGRLNSDQKSEYARIWEAIEENNDLQELEGSGWKNLLFKLLDIIDFGREDVPNEGPVTVNSVTTETSVGDITSSYDLRIRDVQGIDNISNIQDKNSGAINFVNRQTFKVTTNGNGILFGTANWKQSDETTEIFFGAGQGEYEITVPIFPIAEATSSGALTTGGSSVNYTYTSNKWSATDNNSVALLPPTSMSFKLSRVSGVTPIENEFIEWDIALGKMNKITNTGRSILDGYREDISIELDVSTERQKNKIANYMGITKDELSKFFPIRTRSRNLDLTKFGPDLINVDITIKSNPQADFNSSYNGYLNINGQEYRANDIKHGLRQATTIFRNIAIENTFTTKMSIVYYSELKVTDDNTQYQLYSQPIPTVVNIASGKLAAVNITSGATVNVTENIFKFEGGFDDTVSIGDINGVTGGPEVNALERHVSTLQRTYGKGEGSNDEQNPINNALYNLTGTKSRGTTAYAVIEDTNDNVTLRVIGDSTKFINQGFDIPIIGGVALNSNRFNSMIILPWEEGKNNKYTIRVYQTNNESMVANVKSAMKLPSNKRENELIRLMGQVHGSEKSQITVLVENSAQAQRPVAPNWQALSLGAFFPFADPIERVLNDLVEIVKQSIPAGPYDAIQDWLDVMKRKIDTIIKVFKQIQDIIDNINALLQIGGTGFYFLGIDQANGVEGFKQRLKKAPVPPELSSAKFVTGLQILVPSEMSEPFTGASIPAGSLLMDTVFANLPSNGQDNIKVPDQVSLADQLKDIGQKAKGDFNKKFKEIKDTAQSIETLVEDRENVRKAVTKLKGVD